VAGEGDGDAARPRARARRGEGGDAGGLDGAVEALVPGGEALEVRAVARAVDVEEGDDQAGALVVAADAAGRLDVLGGGLGLAEHDHEAEAGDVEADGDHVGGEGDVDALLIGEAEAEAALGLGDLAGATREVSSCGRSSMLRSAKLPLASPSRRRSP
jgi:hypothetical protein